MRHARLRLFVVILLAVAACDDPTDAGRAGPVPLVIDGAPAGFVLPAGADYYLEPVTIERTTGTQNVEIPLAGRPWLDFMEPFELYVVRSDSIGGKVLLDDVAVQALGRIAPLDTVSRRLDPLLATSTIDVVLTGRARGTVTLWIVGRLQPAPVFTMESPIRSEMLDSGSTGIGSVPVRGRVCHARFPITQVKLYSQVLPLTQDGRCASFSTSSSLAFGTGLILLEATNARGRKGWLVQSLIRADHFLQTLNDGHETTVIVPGPSLVLAPSAVDDGSRADLDDLATLIFDDIIADSLDNFPTVFFNGEPSQPLCSPHSLNRRGYRIERNGPVTYATAPTSLALVEGGANMDVRFNTVVVPVLVRAFVKRPCDTPLTGVSTGTATFGFGLVDVPITLSLDGPTVVATGADPIAGMTVPGVSITFGRGSQLTTAQQEEAVARIRDQLPGHLSNVLIALGIEGRDSVAALLNDARLDPGTDYAALGIDVTHRIGHVGASSAALSLSFRPRVVVPEIGSIAPAARGPVHSGSAPDLELLSPALGIAGIDYYNAVFWGAWRAGHFDRVDLLDHASAPDIDGLRVRLRPMLPPTLQIAPQGNFFRIAWGDLRMDLTVDPSVWGDEDPGAEEIRARAWGTVFVDVALDYDPATRRFTWAVTQVHGFPAVQVPASWPTWIDHTALRGALEELIWAVAPQLVVDAMSAAPMPAAIGELRIAPTEAVRNGGFLDLRGTLVAD